MKKFFKKNIVYILSFIIPFMTLLAVFMSLRTFYKYVNLQSDLHSQYIAFFNYFKELVSGNQGIYTFSNGLRRKYVWNDILLFI